MTDFFELSRDTRGVATLRIANTARANALGSDLMDALIAELHRLGADGELRVLILASVGDRAFVAGADLNEMAHFDPPQAENFIRLLARLCDTVRALPVPVIARVQGWCLGGGLELAAACDIRVASRNARFAMPEVRMGIPSVIHAALLPRTIGRGRAAWLMLTADAIDAEQASDWGLIDRITDPAQLDAVIEEIVGKLLASERQVLAAQKALLTAWDEVSLSDGIELSVAAFRASFETGEPRRLMSEHIAHRKSRPHPAAG